MTWIRPRTTSDGVKRWVACYRDPEGRQRSAGTFSSKRAAERAAQREEQRVLAGSWRDHTLGEVRFRDYVETDWLPSKHIEPTTKAAYQSNLDRHFYPSSVASSCTRSPPAWSRTGSPRPPTAGSRRGRSASTTPCCTRSSPVRSATD